MPRVRLRAVILAYCLLAALVPAVASAEAVTNTNDSGPGSLRKAISEAAPGSTVSVPAGTYSLKSQLRIEKGIDLTGAGAASTTIEQSGEERLVLIEAKNPGEHFAVTISGVTLRGGHLVDPGGLAEGGAIFERDQALTLDSDVIAENVADASGTSGSGGIAWGGGVDADQGTLTIDGSRIEGNTVLARGGKNSAGGIAAGGGVYTLATNFTIHNTTISGNRANGSGPEKAKEGDGAGGIAEGAGLALGDPEAASSIVDSTISGNTATAAGAPGSAGGIAEGGGIHALPGKVPFSVIASTIAGNVAATSQLGIADGGGIVAFAPAGGNTAFVAVTIAGNSVEGPTSPSVRAGNIEVGEVATISDSIVAGGRSPAGVSNCGDPPEVPTSIGFNIEDADTCGFGLPGDQVGVDPQLGPLQDNGGPVPTMLPALSSPAIDRGSAEGLVADARGVLRPIDFPGIANPAVAGADGADVGAAELQPSGAITLGKVVRQKSKGTARFRVNIPEDSFGSLTLSGRGIRKARATADGRAGSVGLTIATAKGKVRRALKRTGKRKVSVTITYTPFAGAPVAKTLRTKLILRKRHHRHHHGGRPPAS